MAPAGAQGRLQIVADAGVPADLVEEVGGYLLPHAEDVLASVGAAAAPTFTVRLAADGAPAAPPPGPGLALPAGGARMLLAAGVLRQLSNGLLLVPTLRALSARGVLDAFGTRAVPREATLLELARRASPGGLARTLGNLAGALRMLALQRWLATEGLDEEIRYRVTPEGWTVLETLRDRPEPFAAATAFLRFARQLHVAIRSGAGAADVAEYRRLADASAAGWLLPAGRDPVARRVLAHLRRHLDGVVVCPTMVALAMPPFARDGNALRAAGPALADAFAAEGTLDRAALDGAADPAVLGVALDLLATQGLLRRGEPGRPGAVALTAPGRAMFRAMAAAAMPVSYLPTYERLDEVLFEDPDPLGMDRDRHVDRVMNVFGSSAGASVEACQQVSRTILVKLFDEAPLEAQPAGIADMGCGDGLALRSLVDFVLRETRRGRALARFPLAVIGADFNEAPRERARATLAPLGAIAGVRVAVIPGDVGRPDRYDEEILRLGLEVAEPGTGARRALGAADLLHTLMFLAHDRALAVRSRAEALQVLREAVAGLGRPRALAALRRAAGGTAPEPDGEDALVAALAAQFTTSFSDTGALVPGVVAGADLVRFLGRWRPYARHGLVVIEAHDARPADMAEDVPVDPRAWMRQEKLAYPAVWGMHYLSRQFMLPYLEHELALALAGLEPMGGRTWGGVFTDALPRWRQVSVGCYR